MIVHRRALAEAALGLSAGILSASIAAEAQAGENFDNGVAVQRVYDAEGRLFAVDASNGAEWVSLLRRE